ncbi:very short patch repair endonuclease [Sphingomonas sp. Leaf37]|uniref:very short patch repair endonuclease n=1 Tax=Sphingomonas sp. Leaf37 TaxID=2876552 RepID=UPI001E30BE9C|nr:very short patch repair endonuclease [Sphingomonas sp. Leaf37]
MADIVPADVRSRMMAGIRSTNTKPELLLRRGLHARGLRFRLHDRDLPGTPDLVFPRHRGVVFAHGCFWHGHDCHLFKWPKTRDDFWRAKIARNRAVDVRSEDALANGNWRVATVWECALKGRTRLDHGAALDILADWVRGSDNRLELRGTDRPGENA